MTSDMHELLYSDLRLVLDARSIARASIAQRKLREALIDSWALPLVITFQRHLDNIGARRSDQTTRRAQ